MNNKIQKRWACIFYEIAVVYLVIQIDVFYSDGQGSDVSKGGPHPLLPP